MKSKIKYVAEDGAEFNSEADCLGYEALCAEVEEVMSLLPTPPDLPGCAFANGRGYMQLDRETFLKVKVSLLKIADRISPHRFYQQTIDDETAHPSWAGRMIDECTPRPLGRAWHRIMCVDKDYREWGQPYYANNPQEGEQICHNG